ncbi:MAG: MmcQ/YjbR family DNA-binding protein [Candidatus Nanopelagicales bacterium]
MTTIDAVRVVVKDLPRSYEVLVYDRVKFRVGQLVYVSFSKDETLMGVGYPKHERQAAVDAEPDKFLMPKESDQRFNWIVVRLAAIDDAEMQELVLDAWRMVVPKRVATAHLGPY